MFHPWMKSARAIGASVALLVSAVAAARLVAPEAAASMRASPTSVAFEAFAVPPASAAPDETTAPATVAAPHAASAPPAPPAPSAPSAPPAPSAPAAQGERPRVLVFSRTKGFRHESIPDGIQAIRELLADRYDVDATEDAALFTPDNLKRYRAVVFLSTTGDVLDDAQQRAFEAFVRAGGGYAGVHAASDTEYEWPWYAKLVGAYFNGHPKPQQAVVVVEDRTHPSTRMLPARWERFDEWYAFKTNPRAQVHVLASLDESTYQPETTAMGGDHPLAWYHAFDGGRAWYTALGHTKESYAEPLFRAHLDKGIRWAAGEVEAPAVAPHAAPAAPAAVPPGKPRADAAQAGIRAGAPLLAQAPGLAPAGSMNNALLLAAVMLVGVIVLGAMNGGIRPAVLAWLWPGAGYLALGYRKRGLLAMTGVVGMCLIGLFIGGIDAVDSNEDAAWFVPQAANGPIVFLADWADQALLKTGRVGELLPAPAPIDPSGRPIPGSFTISSYKGLGAANEFGTLFIALAGMMNMLLVMDASRREPAERADA